MGLSLPRFFGDKRGVIQRWQAWLYMIQSKAAQIKTSLMGSVTVSVTQSLQRLCLMIKLTADLQPTTSATILNPQKQIDIRIVKYTSSTPSDTRVTLHWSVTARTDLCVPLWLRMRTEKLLPTLSIQHTVYYDHHPVTAGPCQNASQMNYDGLLK